MIGIGGVFSVRDGGHDPNAIAIAMGGRNNAADHQTVFPAAGGLVIANGSAADLANDDGRGLTAAISGKPRWRDKRLGDLAVAEGMAAALLAGYSEDGDGVLQKIGGTFAIAIVDRTIDGALLAVDRMGIQPLCYALPPGGDLVFGSAIETVLAHPGVSATIDPQSLYRYVYFHVVPSPATIYADIRKLELAQSLWFRSGSATLSRYWEPSFDVDTGQSAGEQEAELMQRLRDAVAHSGRDDTTAAFLSGGLDSSTVCGLASELSDEPLRAFSIGFAEDGYDEIEFARIAAKRFNLDLREYYVTPDDVADAIPVIAQGYDEPFGNSSALPVYFCGVRAREDGVTRLLAGDGGDELFAGNERYATQQVFERYWRVPAWLRSAVVEPLAQTLPTEWSTFTHKARRYIEQARVPMPERLQTYNTLHVNPPDSVFDREFLRDVDTRGPVDEMGEWYQRGSEAGLIDRMLVLDWKLTLADNDIRKVNQMCAAAGVDVDYPMLDDELVEFSTRVPAGLKLRGGNLRHFYKQGTADLLPPEIIRKTKHGFGLPFGEWLRQSKRLQDIAFPSMQRLRDGGVFRPEYIDGLLDGHANVHAAYFGNTIWVLMMLDQWLQAHTTFSERPAEARQA